MWRTVFRSIILSVFALGFVVGEVMGQGPTINVNLPSYTTIDQQTILLYFGGAALSGSTNSANFTVKINTIAVAGASTGIAAGSNSIVPFVYTTGAYVIPGGAPNTIWIRFDATNITPGHPAFMLPTDVLTIRYTNPGNTLLVGGVPATLSTGIDIPVKNNYVPVNTPGALPNDISFSGENFVPGQNDICAPVDTQFWTWTYQYSLRYRNSGKWVTQDNRLRVYWQTDGAAPFNDLKGYLSTPSGIVSITEPVVPAGGPGGGPFVFVSFRSSLNTTQAALGITSLVPLENQHIYPDLTGVCNFETSNYPIGVNNAVYSFETAGLAKGKKEFVSFDYDNGRNQGTMSLTPTVPPALGTTTTELVCIGTNVGVKFIDTSVFNCVGNGTFLTPPGEGALSTPINKFQRWVRIIYGGANSGVPANNIPNVQVGAPGFEVPVTDASGALLPAYVGNPKLAGPFNPLIPDPNPGPMPNGYVYTGGGADANGVITLPANATVSNLVSELISTSSTAGQAIGQRFYITIQYWGICNPYTMGYEPVEISADWVEIVGKPAPITTTGQSICYTTTGANTLANGFTAFTAVSVSGTRTGVNWYKDMASYASKTKMANGANSLTMTRGTYNSLGGLLQPISNNNAGGKRWSVFVTQVEGGACESDPVEIVLYQQPDITTLATDIRDIPLPNPAPDVCNGSTVGYTEAELVPVKTISAANTTNGVAINFNTENFWSHTFPTGGANTTSITPAASPSGTASVTYGINPEPLTFTDGTIGVALRYKTPDPPNVTVTTNFPPPFPYGASYTYTIAPGACANTVQNPLAQRVYSTSAGGSISPASQTICDLTVPGQIQITGTVPLPLRGTIQGWEKRVNGAGGFIADGLLGVANPLTPPPASIPLVGGVQTTYEFRAVIKNGPCSTVNSPVSTLIINPIPPKPTISALGATTFCFGGSVTLTSSNVGGLAASYKWYKGGVATGDVGSSIVLTTVAQSGDYTVEVIGVAPSNCTSPTSDPTTVTINPLPTAPNPTGGGAVCSGNPAPDIVWTGLTGKLPFDITYTQTPGGPVTVLGHNSTTFTIVAPMPGVNTTYQITTLIDGNGCPASPGTMGNARSVTIGGSAPLFDSGPTLTPTSTCDDGGSTTDPQLLFSLDDAGSANQTGFILTYQIDGSVNRFKNFNTTAGSADPIAPVTFNDAEFNSTVPTPHVLRIVSIQSPAGCQTIFNTDLNFRVNPRPPPPVNPINAIACSSDPTGATLAVDDPGVGNLIQWFTDMAGTIAAVGATGGVRQEQFTPTSNVTLTYYAYAESQTVPTLCRSTSGTAVQHTQDIPPTPAANFPDFSTCSTTDNLTATPADNGGSGLWTIGSAVYYESFPSSDNGLGITGPNPHATSFTHPTNNWSITLPNPNLFTAASDWLKVDNGRISARDVNSTEVVWESKVINLAGTVDIAADIAETGVQAGTDYIHVFYKINGGAETQFGAIDGDGVDGVFQTVTATGIGVAGNTLQIVMRAKNNGATDEHWLDNIRVSSTGSSLPVISDPSDPNSSVSNLQVGANTFTWTITSALGACSPTNDQVIITRHALPVAVDPLPQLCEDTFGSTDATVTPAYLTTLDNTVNGGNPLHTVKYYIAPTRLPGDEIVGNIMVSSTDQVYTRVTRTDVAPQCTQDGIVTFTVNPLPVANDQIYSVCEETVGSANKDNNNLPVLFNDLVTGIVGSAGRTVDWYFDPGGAVNGPGDLPIGLLLTPAQAADQDGVTDGTIYYALVTNTTQATNCQNVASVEFDIQSRPLANPIVGQPNVCASNSIVVYQLSSVVPGSTFNWTLPPNNPGFFEVVFGGGVNDFFVGLRFPALTTPPVSDIYNISVIETSPVASGACAGNANNFAISVDSSPAVNPIIGPDPVCKNQGGVIYQVQNPNPTNTYSWSISAGDAGIIGPAAGVGRTSIVVDFGTSNSSTIEVVESSPTGCSLPAPQVLVVNAFDTPVMTSTSTFSMCSGQAPATAPVPLVFTAAPGGNNFSWKVLNVPATITGAVVGNTGVGNINQVLTNVSGVSGVVTYEVTPKATVAPFCAGPPQNVFVTVQPQPVIVAGQSKSVCSGSPVNYHVNLIPLGLPANTEYSWPDPDGAGPASSGTNVPESNAFTITDVLTNTTGVPFDVTYVITPTVNGGLNCTTLPPVSVVITVEPQPVIVPGQAKTICSGSTVDFHVDLNPAGLPANTRYSWPDPDGAGPATAGINVPESNAFTITDALVNNTGVPFDVTYMITPTVNGGLNCTTLPAVPVVITVEPQPVIAAGQTKTICSGSGVDYHVNLLPAGLPANTRYNWGLPTMSDASAQGTVGVNVPESNAFTLTDVLVNKTGADITATYNITPTVNGGLNCTTLPPIPVVITIQSEPVAQALSTIERCSGDPINFDIQDIINNVAPFAGGNLVNSKFRYTVIADFPLDVAPAVFPGLFDRVVATGANISETFSNLSGHDVTLTYTVTPISDPQNCEGTPFTLEVVIHPEPVGSNVIDPVCSTSLNHDIQTQITNPGGLASIFTYTVSSDNGGVPAGPDRLVASNALITDVYVNGTGMPANITYTITPFNAAHPTCAGTPFTYTVNISPNPTGVSDTKAAVCSDVPFSIDPQGNIVPAVPSTFTWTATYDFPLAGPAAGSGLIAGALHNETNGQVFAHYTVTPKAGTCTGAPFTIDLPVNPEPVMEPTLSALPAVCSSNAVSTSAIGVTLQTNGVSIAADSYIVTLKSQAPGLVGIPTTGTFPANSPIAGQSDAISTDTYRNITSAQLQVVYTIVPVSVDGCQGDAFDVTISVNPEPVLDNPGFPDVCSSNAGISNPVNIVLGTNGTSASATSYQLQNIQYSDGGPFGPVLPPNFTANPSNAVILGPPGSINIIKNDRYTNRSAVAVTVRYTIQGYSSQGCASEFLDYDVMVNPEPVLDPALSPAPVCSDVASGVTLGEAPGSVAAATYNINNIIRQPGLVAGGSNASIGLGQPNNAIFNDIFTNTTSGTLTVTYKIAPVSALGCVGVEADVVFTVNPAPAVATNLNRTVCYNSDSGIIFGTTGTSAPVSGYDITNIVYAGAPGDLVQTNGNTGFPRLAVNANEIQVDRFQNTTNAPLTVTYTVRGNGLAPTFCMGPTLDIVLTVEPEIIATPVNNSVSICSSTPTDIDLLSPTTPTSGAGNVTFNYTVSAPPGVTGYVPSLNNLPLGYKITDNLVNNNDNVVIVTYAITPVATGAAGGAGCMGTPPVNVVVNVEPKPKLIASPLVQTVCESDGVNVSPTNILLTSTTVPSLGTLEFNQISAVATGGMTLLSPLKTTYLNGESITDQWDNPTLTDQTVTYTMKPQVSGGLGCPGDDVVVTVTIKPRPIISPVGPQMVCSGEYRSIPFTTDIPGTFATWTVTPNANITGELNGGGGSLDITLFNTGFNVETVTYTVTPKFNNCDGIPINIVVTVNPTPNTVGLPPTITVCDGATLNVPLSSAVPGTTFDWVVTDVFNLEAPGFFDGNGTTINQVVNNPNGFQAVLIYQITPTSPDGCVGLPKIMNVNVGSIVANVTPDQTSICSGRRIQMTNSSLGATSHRWFYRVQGTTAEIDVRTTPFVNYQLDNTTTTNPLVYEIVYQPSNGLCSIPDVVTPITVYRNVVAGFDEGTVPPIVGGTSTVNFTNTSNPTDGTQFRYEWDFGSGTFASPATFVGATPPPVVYSQQGPYQVTIKAINIAAETAGLQCESTFFKNIVVPVLPLVANFTLDPPAGCFPTTVKVIENLSTGDVMEWKVVDSNGKVVAISGEDLPEFFISTPGLFNVQLTTRDSFTDQVEFANQDFEIYDLPIASFQARPTTVFVPDTELTTFNFSTGADFYQWDFGDGETSDEREPKYTYKIEGVYDIVLVAGFDHGGGVVCTDTLTQKVVAKQGGQTKVPNAFTPNPAGPSGGVTGGGGGGTFNDVFLPIVKGVEEFNMQIFDRWGNLIFESNSSNTGWDGYDRNGNILPAGVYIYKLTLRLSDGQRTTQIGDITMIR